jgi:hypothetical protein
MEHENVWEAIEELSRAVSSLSLRNDELERRLSALEEESDFDAEINNPMSSAAEDRRTLRLA